MVRIAAGGQTRGSHSGLLTVADIQPEAFNGANDGAREEKPMISRRTFSTLLAGSVAAPGLAPGLAPTLAWAKASRGRVVLYSGVGDELTHYQVYTEAAILLKRNTVKLPGPIQYAWLSPAKKFLYVTSSTGGPGASGDQHHATVFAVDRATGELTPVGEPVKLRSRPIHNSVDNSGEYLLTAYNNPSGVSVHRLKADGSIGDEVPQPEKLDTGIYAHQVRVTPSNQSVILVTRGNNATANKPEDPGSLKVFGFKNGVLSNKAAVQPGNGLGFGPRHLAFHPRQPWVFVSVERQNQLYVYKLEPDGGLDPKPMYVTSTLLEPDRHVSSAGPIHVHPSGRFVYLTNRGGFAQTPVPGAPMHDGLPIFDATNSSIAVFDINQQTGEPKLLETPDTRGGHPRTFGLDGRGQLLVAASLSPVAVRDGNGVKVLGAGFTMFRVERDGRLKFARRLDINTGGKTQWWAGVVELDIVAPG
jgi:6-phosphogluconolactonase